MGFDEAGWWEGYVDSMERAGGNPTLYCEKALLGALLVDGGLRARVRTLTGREFSDPALGRIFDMLMDVDGPIDLVIALAEAEKRGLGKAVGSTGIAAYLASLLDLVPDVENVESYAKYIKRASIAREVEKMRARRAAERLA